MKRGSLSSRRKGTRAEVDENQRQQFVNSRLQALEEDGYALELDNSDEEFQIEDVLDEVSIRNDRGTRRGEGGA